MLDIFYFIFPYGEGKYVTQIWIIDDYYFLRIVSTGGKKLTIEIRNTFQKRELGAMTLCLFLSFIYTEYILLVYS